MITGNVSGPCMSGFYYITQLPKTNLFMLIIENWKQYKDTVFYNFNCKIAQRWVIESDMGSIGIEFEFFELELRNFELELKFPTKTFNPQINLPFLPH